MRATYGWLIDLLDRFCQEHGGWWHKLDAQTYHQNCPREIHDPLGEVVSLCWHPAGGGCFHWEYIPRERDFGPGVAKERMNQMLQEAASPSP